MGTVEYLLDTHTFLWAVCEEGSKLSEDARKTIENAESKLLLSSASAYEIMYKHRIGKLPGFAHIAENYFDILSKFGIYELPVNTKHAHYAGKIEWNHRDPFDRLLAAQASIDNLTFITNDPAFQQLSWVTVLW
jgi:PIN domain nuclease of toxin-antitoxin system